MISIDLVGDVPAEGRTVEEIAEDVQKRISRYKRGANVTVSVVNAASPTITMLGEVGNTNIALTKTTRVAEAVGMAGGTNTAFASERNIRVIRTGGGETVVYKVDLAAIQGGDLRTNIVLTGGDIIYVPPTILARIGYAVNALLFPLSPLLGLATSVAGGRIAGL